MTKFNFLNRRIVLFSLAVSRLPVVFDLLLQFAYNLHNLDEFADWKFELENVELTCVAK